MFSSPSINAAVKGLVLCAPDDPYEPLAKEISTQTGYPLVTQPDAAVAHDPAFLIWVTAPDRFSDRDLVAYAMHVRHRSSSISLGFITGKTLEQARALWQRRTGIFGNRFAIANGSFPTTGRFSNRLVAISNDVRSEMTLTLAGFQEALARADYATFTGHVRLHGSDWIRIQT